MKKLFTSSSLIFTLLFCAGNLSADNHQISVGNFSFSPSFLNVQVGDTVTWVWNNGIHTSTSDLIPAGAASWDEQIEDGHPSFSYVVTVPGTYNYHCTFHQTMGMTGSFVAGSTTGVNTSAQAFPDFSVVTNKSDNSVVLKINIIAPESLVFRLMDISGKVVFNSGNFQAEKNSMLRFYPGILTPGIYLCEISSQTKKGVKRILYY